MLKNALDQVRKLEAERIKLDKALNETNTTLIQKMAVITTLEEKNKRLLEEKTELQTKLNQFLRQYGKVVTAPVPVTPTKEPVQVAQPVTTAIGLKGKITQLDLKNSVAAISIGSAHGVKENMRFHVTRADKYICDILIFDVDAERAVGFLKLVQQPPKVGDTVSTNL